MYVIKTFIIIIIIIIISMCCKENFYQRTEGTLFRRT